MWRADATMVIKNNKGTSCLGSFRSGRRLGGDAFGTAGRGGGVTTGAGNLDKELYSQQVKTLDLPLSDCVNQTLSLGVTVCAVTVFPIDCPLLFYC